LCIKIKTIRRTIFYFFLFYFFFQSIFIFSDDIPPENKIGFGLEATAENIWASNTYIPDMSNTTQAFSYFNFLWFDKKADPEDEAAKRDGCIKYILDASGKLYFRVKFSDNVSDDVKNRFADNIEQS
jgi:hypothetical protein